MVVLGTFRVHGRLPPEDRQEGAVVPKGSEGWRAGATERALGQGSGSGLPGWSAVSSPASQSDSLSLKDLSGAVVTPGREPPGREAGEWWLHLNLLRDPQVSKPTSTSYLIIISGSACG